MAEAPIITGRLRLKDETEGTLERIRSRFTGTFKDIGSVAGGIIAAEFAQNITGALEDVSRRATDSAASFELATARIIAAVGATGEEAERLRRQLEETAKTLGIEYGVGATAAMEAMESLVKAGLEGGEAVKALAGVLQLAAIEGIDTATAAKMVVQAMTQFNLSAGEATRVVDGFVKASAAGIDTAAGYASGLANVGATAHAMGLSLEETLAALVQLDNTFGSAQVSGTYLNRMLLDLAEKADEAGLSLYRADGSMKSLSQIVEELRAKIQSFGEDQAALNDWLNLFDVRAAKAILALAQYGESLGETQSRMGEMAGAAEAVSIILDTYAGQVAKTRAQKELAAIETGKLTAKIGLLGAQITAALGPVGLLADALGPTLLSGAMEGLTVAVIPQLIEKLAGAGGLTAALRGVGGAVPQIAGLIASSGPLGIALVGLTIAVSLFASAWSRNWFGIRDKTREAVEGIKTWFDRLRDWLGGLGRAWSSFWSKAEEAAEGASRSIVDGLKAIEYGRSPGGLRDVIAAIGEFASTWNRVIGGLAELPEVEPIAEKAITMVITPSLEPPHPITARGWESGRSLTLIFQEGAIQFIEPRMEGVLDRAEIAREIVEFLGKELLRRR